MGLLHYSSLDNSCKESVVFSDFFSGDHFGNLNVVFVVVVESHQRLDCVSFQRLFGDVLEQSINQSPMKLTKMDGEIL